MGDHNVLSSEHILAKGRLKYLLCAVEIGAYFLGIRCIVWGYVEFGNVGMVPVG